MNLMISSDLNNCPRCKGTGKIIIEKHYPELYGDKKPPVEVAVDCPDCNGGHEVKVYEAKKYADIPASFYDKHMSDFNWKIYIDKDGNTIDLSKQKSFVDSFINNFHKWESKGLGLYIQSNMKGSGKTFLASCICNELMRKYAIRTHFVSAPNLIELSKSGNPEETDEYKRDPIKLLCNCKLLVLDDLGQKNTGLEWYQDLLFKIIDKRMNEKSVTVITSNLKNNALPYDDRIFSRIDKMTQFIPLPEYCVRTRESNEEKLLFFRELGLIK